MRIWSASSKASRPRAMFRISGRSPRASRAPARTSRARPPPGTRQPEVEEAAIGRRIGGREAPEHRRGRVGAGSPEGLAGHDLEQIPARERLLGLPHRGRVRPGRMVAARDLVVAARGLAPVPVFGGRARQSRRRRGAGLEVVGAQLRRAAGMVDDDQLVRQVEDEVAPVLRARDAALHRLELVGEVVSEGAIEAELSVLAAAEEIAQRAHQREDGGLPASILLTKSALRSAHCAGQRAERPLVHVDVRMSGQDGEDRGQQHAPAPVQGLDGEAPLHRRDRQRWIAKAHVPARVAAGCFHAG